MALTVSALARTADVSADTVRYYEHVGLLAPTDRTAAGYRLYDEEATRRLRLIRGAQRVGLRLSEIGEVLEVMDRGQCPCGHTEALLGRRIAEVDAEMGRLADLRDEMIQVRNQCRPGACVAPRPDGWWCEAEFTKKGGDGQWRSLHARSAGVPAG
ncbi:MAG: MerR family transcriptional regulator [Acidimicrobiales bacterium]